MKNQKGFTLIELLIVVIIIGILAAYAVPKYMALDREARIAVTKGLKGSIHAAADMVHAIAVMQGNSPGTTVVNIGGGHVVEVATNFYPTGELGGIPQALADWSGFDLTSSATAATFTKKGAANPSQCYVKYDNLGTIGSSPVITLITTGC